MGNSVIIAASRPRAKGAENGARTPDPGLSLAVPLHQPAHLRRRVPARSIVGAMEFLNFLIILWIAWLLWRRPERERLALRLLVISCLLMALCFFIGSHGSVVPGVNL